MSKPSVGRSPAYPFFDLEKAVKKLQEMYQYAKRAEVNIEGLYKHWGFNGITSSAIKTLAALKYYGLIAQSGKGEQKKVQITERGLRIVLDHDGSKEKELAIKQAALTPLLYKFCWDKWGQDLPHDNAIRQEMIFAKGFNESTVEAFITDYKKTLEYSNLLKDGLPIEKENIKVSIGDLIQWESNGELQFTEPRRVTKIFREDDCLNVEGDNTRIPINEVKVIKTSEDIDEQQASDKFETKRDLPPLPKLPKKEENIKQDTFTLEEGQAILQWPANMDADSFEDFKAWLELQMRKIKRSIKSSGFTDIQESD